MLDLYRDRPYAAHHFAQIVEHARNTNPFYRRRITDPAHVPVLGRTTVLEHNDEILNGYPATVSTSGSTSIPVRISQSPEWSKLAARDTAHFVRLLGGPLPRAQIIYTDEKERSPAMLSVKTSIDEQLAFLERRRQEENLQVLITYPSNLLLLGRAIMERGVETRNFRRVGLYSEAVEPFHREMVRKAFPNAKLWTTYSSMEFAMIAFECPYEPEHHHIMAHRLGVEVLRDDGDPAEDGERGRVVITDYFNRQSPLIRYELGDYAVRGPCPCGRIRFPALTAIYGKIRGALLHRNGDRIVFTDLSVALRSLDGMRQYQIIQTGVEDFEVKIAATRNLEAEIRDAFLVHFRYVPERLRFTPVDSIPPGPNGKFYASICTV